MCCACGLRTVKLIARKGVEPAPQHLLLEYYPLVVRIMIKHDSGYCSTPLLIAGDLDCLNNWRLLESLGQIGTNPH